MFVHLSISVAMLKIRSRAKKGEGQLGGWLVQIQCVCVCMDPSYLPPFWHAFVVRPRFLRATVLKRNSEVTLAILLQYPSSGKHYHKSGHSKGDVLK